MGERSIFPPLSEESKASSKKGRRLYCKTRSKMCPGDKTQTFYATIHQLALQNIVPSFSFKASHNDIFIHMLTHFKQWGLINVMIKFFNFKSDGQVWAFYFKIPFLPHPGGAWFSWSNTHPLSRRSLPAVSQNSQPEQRVTLESTGCTTPNAHLQIPTNSFPSQLRVSEHRTWLAVPYNKPTLCSRVWCPESSRPLAAGTDTNSSVLVRGQSVSRLLPFVVYTS